MKRGKFITFEGPDGSGKTTVSTAVTELLEKAGYPVRYTREPGGSTIAEEIRDVILDPANTAMDARTEALLYAASRRQHLVEVILPALQNGTHVISDRFVDSSLAYQGCGRHLGIDEVFSINRFAIDEWMPDKTIYLDIDAATGLQRIKGRSFLDRLDQEGLSFHQDVWNGYQQIIRKYADRMIIVDASRPAEEVIAEAFHIVKGLLDEEN
ncbi:MAG: dTMP kinase [Solobacterium sp.]|nr:dTMP kinase [Solobacterium sp.]MBR2830210.1 dTMP kinase [Solobacterium sp.]MBR3127597.1 dTMP kinase [Solobacterium sp.]